MKNFKFHKRAIKKRGMLKVIYLTQFQLYHCIMMYGKNIKFLAT